MPPSTNKITPLIPLAFGEARNRIAFAISFASKNSFFPYLVGIGMSRAASIWASVIPCVIGVVVLPGATELILRPSTAQEGETRRTHLASACLLEL